MYALFDLANLAEAILLAPKLVTLPGEAVQTNTATFLQDEGLLEEVKVEEDMADIISSIKYTWDSNSALILNKEKIAKILCDIFPVQFQDAYNAVSNSNQWASEVYRTPNWSVTKGFVTADVAGDHYLGGGMSYVGDLHFRFEEAHKTHPRQIQEILKQTFVRGIFYMLTASSREYNYYPDAVRIPIIAFINTIFNKEVSKTIKKELMKIDDKIGKRIDSLNKANGYGKFEITVPSAFSMVLKDSDKKEQILEKALELRKSSALKKFRTTLAKLEESARRFDPKFFKQKEELEAALDPREFDRSKVTVIASQSNERAPYW